MKPIINKAIKNKKTCNGACGKSKVVQGNYYQSKNPLFDGYLNICTKCIKDNIDYNDMGTVYRFLRQINVMFDCNIWNSAVNSSDDTLGSYMRMSNMNQFEGKTFDDSVFELEKPSENKKEANIQINNNDVKFIVTDEITERWGFGFEDIMYEYFEKKYAAIKNNYSEKTSLHTEALITYVIYKVKAELATAKGNVKDAKDWNTMAKDAATAAKINPSQLSKSDLSDGIDTISQLVRTVEKAVDIIPILPQFKALPKDKADFTLFCYINYIRDLKGLPLAEYLDIWQFYEDRKNQYKDVLDFLNEREENE